jgi:hypothetical protein
MTQSFLICHIITIYEIYFADRQRELDKTQSTSWYLQNRRLHVSYFESRRSNLQYLTFFCFEFNAIQQSLGANFRAQPQTWPKSELSANIQDLVRTQCLIILKLVCSCVSINILPFAKPTRNSVQDWYILDLKHRETYNCGSATSRNSI